MLLDSLNALDHYTRQHLNRWLTHARGNEGSDERRKALERIARALQDDPTLIEHGDWTDIERMGKWLLASDARSANSGMVLK